MGIFSNLIDFLPLFAEVSIAIIAFTSIVVELVRQEDPQWNKYLFNGITGHAIGAFTFSTLPYLIKPITEDMNPV